MGYNINVCSPWNKNLARIYTISCVYNCTRLLEQNDPILVKPQLSAVFHLKASKCSEKKKNYESKSLTPVLWSNVTALYGNAPSREHYILLEICSFYNSLEFNRFELNFWIHSADLQGLVAPKLYKLKQSVLVT